jgi:hypothetical protein
MTFIRVAACLKSFLIAGLLASAPFAFAEQKEGIPSTGLPGVKETTVDIMARQRRADLLAQGKPKKIRFKKEHEIPNRDHLPQNPDSPNAARWVPSQSIADSQTTLTPLSLQTLDVNFTAATLADTHSFPPDSMGTVGPSQFVVFVNGRLRTFEKATGIADGVLNVDPDVFFARVMTPVISPVLDNFTSDPQIRYDRFSGRWFLTIIDVPCTTSNCSSTAANRLLIALSATGMITPSTAWTFYFFQGDTSNSLDYPSLGIDANAMYIGGNIFNSSGTSFLGCNAYVIRKSSVLTGGPIVVTKFSVVSSASASGPFAPRGVDNYDPASNEGYFIGVDNVSFGRLMLRRVSNPGGTPSISSNISVTVSSTSFPIPVNHLGNTGGNNGRLDALDDRLFAAHIRNGRLWTAHNIRVSSSGVGTSMGGQLRDGVRWYELNVPATAGTPTVVQSGTIFDGANQLSSARQFWIPSVVVSGQGQAVVSFSTAGTPYYADAEIARRLANDPLGTLRSPTNYTTATTAYNPPADTGSSSGRRWGDYSFTSVDPNDDMTMWTIQEFCNDINSYGVRVLRILAPPPATPAAASPSVLTQGDANVSIVISGAVTDGSGFFDPGVGFPNHITASINGGGITLNSVTYNNSTNLTINLTVAADAPTGARTVAITNPDGQTAASASGLLTVLGLAAANFNLAVNKIGAGTGTVTSSPGGIDCGGNCSAIFSSNTVVVLTAIPGTYSVFRDWADACSSTSTCSVMLSSNTTRTADFGALPLIAAASITPASPTTTNDLTANITSANDADGDPITFAYQWQQSTNGVSFADMTDQTVATLPANLTAAGDYYRVSITPNDGLADGQTFTTAALLVPADADGNGVNDDWELQYFGSIGIDPSADPDGDGMSNLAEFLAGTDPTNNASAFFITSIGTSGSNIVVNFTTVAGNRYELQRSEDATSGSWMPVASNIVGTGGTVAATEVGGATHANRIYRVRLFP